jgi:hypothetical protein
MCCQGNIRPRSPARIARGANRIEVDKHADAASALGTIRQPDGMKMSPRDRHTDSFLGCRDAPAPIVAMRHRELEDSVRRGKFLRDREIKKHKP